MTVGELIKKLNKRDRSQTVYYIDKYGKHEITDVKPMLTKDGSVTIIMNGDGGRYDRKSEPNFKVDGIGDNDLTIHAIAHLQKVGWLQEHDRALTENCSEKPNNCEEPQYEMGMGTLKCDNCSEYGSFKCTKCDGEMYFKRLEPKDEPQTEGSE